MNKSINNRKSVGRRGEQTGVRRRGTCASVLFLGGRHCDPKDSRKVAARDLIQCSGPRGGCWLSVVLNPTV